MKIVIKLEFLNVMKYLSIDAFKFVIKNDAENNSGRKQKT